MKDKPSGHDLHAFDGNLAMQRQRAITLDAYEPIPKDLDRPVTLRDLVWILNATQQLYGSLNPGYQMLPLQERLVLALAKHGQAPGPAAEETPAAPAVETITSDGEEPPLVVVEDAESQ